jgi:hypothetical protein
MAHLRARRFRSFHSRRNALYSRAYSGDHRLDCVVPRFLSSFALLIRRSDRHDSCAIASFYGDLLYEVVRLTWHHGGSLRFPHRADFTRCLMKVGSRCSRINLTLLSAAQGKWHPLGCRPEATAPFFLATHLVTRNPVTRADRTKCA